MFDLQLIGHICKDIVIRNNSSFVTLGAMANVWEACEILDSKLNLNLCPTHFGNALIFEDSISGKRYSKANLNANPLEYNLQKAKWNHVLYINHLEDTKFIESLQGTISADICTGKPIDNDSLKYIDYLFISDDDLDESLQSLAKKVRGFVICHSPSGSVYSDGKNIREHKIQKINNLNVLGAGDFFATSFIINMLKEGDLDQAVSVAHEQATKFLLSKK